MAGEGGGEASAATHETTLPFRMADITLQSPLPAHLPMAEAINTVRKEWMFHWKLLRVEWTKNHLIAIAFGLVAFALGSVSTELWNGGDAKISGVDGVLAIDGFHFFQMLISLICRRCCPGDWPRRDDRCPVLVRVEATERGSSCVHGRTSARHRLFPM